MLRLGFLLAVSTLLITFTPALAQQAPQDDNLGFAWQDTGMTAGGGQHGYTTQQTQGNTYGNNGTTTQPARQPDAVNPMRVTTSMPIPGTHLALGNLAYMVEHHSPIGGQLPVTNLDSFVHQSGYNDMIYGDEGTDGPPPYSYFLTIGSGGVNATTGHPSDAPSAWY
jgi:hypothetical protein